MQSNHKFNNIVQTKSVIVNKDISTKTKKLPDNAQCWQQQGMPDKVAIVKYFH